MAEKSFIALKNGIEKSKLNDGYMLLSALGILNVGQKTSKTLMNKFKSIDNIVKASFEELVDTSDVGEITAQNIIDYFKNEDNLKEYNILKEHGLGLKEIQDTIAKIDPIPGAKEKPKIISSKEKNLFLLEHYQLLDAML